MAKFADTLAELLATEGVVVPDGFGDSLTSAYQGDMDESSGDYNTQIGVKDQMIRDLKAAAAIDTIPDDAADSLEEPDAELDADFDDFFGEGDENADTDTDESDSDDTDDDEDDDDDFFK